MLQLTLEAVSVQVAVRDFDQVVAVDVPDEGCAMADAEHIFERGVSSGTTGAGLGPAVARYLTTAVGGRLYLASKDPTTFTLLLLPFPELRPGHPRLRRARP
ncbi:ATP-binding protein [Streptomyces olivaceus]|uniref:ATP-binding protein n=1 Tax=Streptomyces olivaceus TaxID=47716 RepID=UPI0035E1C4B4